MNDYENQDSVQLVYVVRIKSFELVAWSGITWQMSVFDK